MTEGAVSKVPDGLRMQVRKLLDVYFGVGKLDVVPDRIAELDGLLFLSINSPRYILTGDMRESIIGYGPLVVEKKSGRVFVTGSAYSVEDCLRAYASSGMRGLFPIGVVGAVAWPPG